MVSAASLSLVRSIAGRRIQIRLIVLIPLILVSLVLGYGIMYVGIFNALISSGALVIDADRLQQVFLFLKYQLLGSIALSGVIGVLLAYGIVLPLRQLIVGARRVASGDLTQPVAMAPDDEIGSLGLAFNQMLLSLNRQVMETMSGGTLTLNLREEVVVLNSAAQVLLGGEAAPLTGRSITEAVPRNEANARFYELLRDAAAGRLRGSTEVEVVTRTGSRLALMVNTTLLRGQKDAVLGILVNFRESQRMQEEMRRLAMAERLMSLGRLAAGFAHEIRNPLGSIRGFTQLLQERLAPDDPRRGHVEIMLKEMDRLNHLVQRLLTLAHPADGSPKLVPVRLHELLDQVLIVAKYDASSSTVRLVKRYEPVVSEVLGDPSELQQAFLNIVLNALHAMEASGGTLTIQTFSDRQARTVRVDFVDTGGGIAPEHLSKIFEPFFTTRPDGTGLGLFITQQIVAAHRGRVEVDSQPSAGATFRVTLPM